MAWHEQVGTVSRRFCTGERERLDRPIVRAHYYLVATIQVTQVGCLTRGATTGACSSHGSAACAWVHDSGAAMVPAGNALSGCLWYSLKGGKGKGPVALIDDERLAGKGRS
jgi:hypothetical protein